jgi:putative ABC transport system permease protein
MEPEEARHAAQRALGNELAWRERCRDMWGFAWLDALGQDLRYAARGLSREPGFTAVVALIVALAVGANTAVFTFFSTFFLRPLPVPEAHRLVRVFNGGPHGTQTNVFSYPDYLDLRNRSRVFDGLAVSRHVFASLATDGPAENATGELVSGNYFATLHVSASQGRVLTAQDDLAPGSFARVVISGELAGRRFGGAELAVGRSLRLNGYPFTVVGVMAPSFPGTHPVAPADFWAPIMMYKQVRGGAASKLDIYSREWGWLSATGRLKPGVTPQQVADDLARVSRELQREQPRADGDLAFVARPARALPDESQATAGRVLSFSLAVTGVLLLVACANLGAMLLARSARRARELAVRRSLGASRSRLLRQGLVESLLLALPGGAGGLLLGAFCARALSRLVPAQLGRLAPELALDARVAAFALLTTVLTSLAIGITPALRGAASKLSSVLKDGGLAGSARRTGRLHAAFVVVQTAACLTLLVVAGLLLRSLRNSSSFDPGFRTDHLLLSDVDVSRLGYSVARTAAFYDALRQRVLGLPGVAHAAYASTVPLGLGMDTVGLEFPGQVAPSGLRYFSIAYNVVGQDYFGTMGIPLVAGRGFDAQDVQAGAGRVAVVNQTLARRFWPGLDPLQASFRMAGPAGQTVRVVGVARDIAYFAPGEAPRPYVYLNPTDGAGGAVTLQVRTRGDVANLGASLREEAAALDPNAVVFDTMSFGDLRAVTLFPARAMSLVAGVFGALVLLLTALGVYGLVSYSVSRRTHEIGIRVALGASRRSVLVLELGRGLRLTALGVAIGLVAAAGAGRLIASQLFGLRPLDPPTLAAGVLLLVGVSLTASYAPARRATRIDPVEALRYE